MEINSREYILFEAGKAALDADLYGSYTVNPYVAAGFALANANKDLDAAIRSLPKTKWYTNRVLPILLVIQKKELT